MNQKDVDKLLEVQTSILNELSPRISRKLLFTLEEKLKLEKQELEQLLGLGKKQTDALSKYTFVLDSQYFDQIFLN